MSEEEEEKGDCGGHVEWKGDEGDEEGDDCQRRGGRGPRLLSLRKKRWRRKMRGRRKGERRRREQNYNAEDTKRGKEV